MTYAACREKLVDFAEPILVLEMRRFRKSSEYLSLVVVTALLLLLPVALLIFRNSDFANVTLVVLAAFYLLAVLALIPSHGGRSIQREREAGTWDLLVLTPLTSRQIVDQKTLAVAAPTLLVLAVGLPADVIAAAIGGVSVGHVVTTALMLGLGALAVSHWSVQSSSDCGRSAIWIAYLPAASYLCSYLSCGGFLVGLALLFNSQVRGQAGRMMLAALCIQTVLCAAVLPMMADMEVFGPEMRYYASLAALVALCAQILALIGMRHLLVWSIETWRRA